MNQQKLMLIPTDIRVAAAEWMEYQSPEGKAYYFSSKTQSTTWEKPKPLLDFEEALKKLNEDEARVQSAIQEHMNQSGDKKDKPVDKSKPVSSTPIGGTPWCIVKTGDQRTFFFNPSTKTSVWHKPKELENVPNVDELLQKTIDGDKSVMKSEAILPFKSEAELIDLETEDNSDQSDDEQKENRDDDDQVQVIEELTAAVTESQKRNLQETEEDLSLKKAKVEEDESRKQMGITSVEALASKQRESIPLEERIQMFTDMLEEKEVSAFSTWEKELHKIVFDARYLLLTSKERKQTFEKYTKYRAESERKEKESKAKKNRQDFKVFIREQFKLNAFTLKCSFKDFLNKFADHKEMKLVERTRDREQLFVEAIEECRKKEKEKSKDRFIELLKENQKYLHRYSRFSDLKDRIRDDIRYRQIEAVSIREELFRQFISNLTKRREEDERKERIKLKEERRSKDRKKSSRSPSKKSRNGTRGRKNESDVDEGEIRSSDEEIVAFTADAEEDDFKLEKDDFVMNNEGSEDELEVDVKVREEQKKEADKQKRAEESIRARERQVQKELHGHLMEREKHRNLYKQQELVDNFNILLIDLIKNPDCNYHDAKKILKRDHRYEFIAAQLSRSERENLFEAHLNTILKKRRKFFVELLEENREISLSTDWREARRRIKDDPRYQQFSEKRCEKEYQMHMKERLNRAKSDFRCLLKETKLITYKSRKLIENTDQQHLADIISRLQNDKRYLDLDLFEDERRQLIIDYIEEMAQKGPPPPPTASDPRRK
jgi:transcription elongation regulator 1